MTSTTRSCVISSGLPVVSAPAKYLLVITLIGMAALATASAESETEPPVLTEQVAASSAPLPAPDALAAPAEGPLEGPPVATPELQDAEERPRFREQITDEPAANAPTGDAVSAVPKRFQYAFRLNIRGVYDDNIFLRHTDRVGDFYFAIEPGLTLGWGDIVGTDMNSVRLDYAPAIFLYGDTSDANSIHHIFRLQGRYRFGHLSLALAQDVQLLEGPNQGATNFGTPGGSTTPGLNIDVGGNTEVDIFTTNASFSYDLTGKTFLSGALNFTAYQYASLISSQQIQGNAFINYIYSPKLTVGLGGTLGYNWVEGNNPDQSFEQVNVRTNYQLSGKVSLDASFGIEFRHVEGDVGEGTNISPVYEVGATYQPFDGTTVTLRGTRRTLNSAVFAAQDYETTNMNLAIRQRFMRRFYFGVAAGYEHTEYFNTVEFVSAGRSDDYFYIQPSVDVTLTRFWTMGAYYLHRRDESSFDAFSFYDNQVGLRTSLTF